MIQKLTDDIPSVMQPTIWYTLMDLRRKVAIKRYNDDEGRILYLLRRLFSVIKFIRSVIYQPGFTLNIEVETLIKKRVIEADNTSYKYRLIKTN